MILKSNNPSYNSNIPIYNKLSDTDSLFSYTVSLPFYSHYVDELNFTEPQEFLIKGFSVFIPEMRCYCAKYLLTNNNLFFFCNHIKTVIRRYYEHKLTPLTKFFLNQKQFAENYFILKNGGSSIIVGIKKNTDWIEIIHCNNNIWIKNLFNPKSTKWNHNINPPFNFESELLFNQLISEHLKINL